MKKYTVDVQLAPQQAILDVMPRIYRFPGSDLGSGLCFQLVRQANENEYISGEIISVNGHPIPDHYGIGMMPGFYVRDDVSLDDFNIELHY